MTVGKARRKLGLGSRTELASFFSPGGVASIFEKLGVASRVELAARLHAREPGAGQ